MSDSAATTVTVTPRKATAHDLPELSATLAAAFHDDPVFTWWIPDADRRREILPGFFDVVVEGNLPGGEVFTEENAIAGAVWSPPGAEDDEEMVGALAELAGEYADTVCDANGLPAYLEATSERNVPLYLRHGFEVTGTIPLRDGPSLTCMWREPR